MSGEVVSLEIRREKRNEKDDSGLVITKRVVIVSAGRYLRLFIMIERAMVDVCSTNSSIDAMF